MRVAHSLGLVALLSLCVFFAAREVHVSAAWLPYALGGLATAASAIAGFIVLRSTPV